MATAEAEPRRRRALQRALALLLSLTVGLAVGELAVRARHGAPLAERLPLGRIEADAQRGWRMVPGEDHYTYQHRVRVNAFGLRGPEVPAQRAPGERRVLALGDSMTYGQGVAGEDTLPARLERELSRLAPDTPWRVINAGHRAYATNQEIALLRQLGPELDPDVVLLLWYDNDLLDVDVAAMNAQLEASGPRPFDASAPLEGEVLLGWRLKQLLRRSALIMHLYDLWKDSRAPQPTAEYYRDGFERLARHLDELARLCAEHGWTPVVAVVPHATTLLADGPAEERAARVRALAAERGIGAVDLLPGLRALREADGRLPVLPYDGHYLPRANGVMAQALAAALAGR